MKRMFIVTHKKIFFMILYIMIIPNCASRLDPNALKNFLDIPKDIITQQKATRETFPFFDISRLYDIFIPEDVSLLDLSNGNDTRKITLSFLLKSALEDLLAEYRTEMAYLGWEELAVFDDSNEECCLIFSRPSRLCSIVFVKSNDGYITTLFIGPKKHINEA